MTTTGELIDSAGRLPGLTEAEAAERRARGEGNTLPSGTSRSYRRIFLENAVTPINLTLFAISLALAVLSLYGDAAMTASLVLANVVVGVFQEARAKRKLDEISLLARPTATVVREGQERVVPPEEVVLGDLLALRPGDQVLVDGEVADEDGLMVDESLLTGESDLIRKRQRDAVHSGTFCMGGSGTYVAQKVGINSLAQQLTVQAKEFRNVQTPLQREVGLVLRVMAVVVVALSVQVISAYSGGPDGLSLRESLRAAAVLASLVPQGLSFMVTVTYSMAVVRMSRTGALIQRINAVESTSNVDVLCLDKTGTLTTNALKLEAIQAIGVGEEEARALLGQYASSTTAGNRTIETIKQVLPGNPAGVREEAAFSSERKWSGITFEDGTYILGAPEVLEPSLTERGDLRRAVQEWAGRGLRVLLFARTAEAVQLDADSGEPRLPVALIPLALVVLSDELRPEVKNTISLFGQAGIALKIISGDNPETVAALAKQAGFPPEAKSVSGLDLEKLNDKELERVAEETSVFGRITPQQKERIIRSLRRRKHYVAMIGDGVNDVLALKRSDLAIAMRSGSQVTRGVADIVLMDDSFATLPKAFLEGQRIRRGMLDIIKLFLVRTLYVALIIFGTTLLGDDFPTTPRQNGVLAFLTVGIPTLALAAWARPGGTPRRLVFSSGRFVIPAALSIAWVGVIVYHFYLDSTGDVMAARAALTTLTILCGVALIPFAQPPTEAFTGGSPLNGDWRPTILAGVMLILYGLILALGPLREFYELQVLTVAEYAIIAQLVFGWAVAVRFVWRADLVSRAGTLLHRLLSRGRRQSVESSSPE